MLKCYGPFTPSGSEGEKYPLMFVVISAILVAFAPAFTRCERAFKYDVLVHMLRFILDIDVMFANVLQLLIK